MPKDHTIPDRSACFELMERYHMPPNIKKHSQIVCQVAMALARELNKNGEHLCLEEIEAGSLLHDITKSKSIETRENHAETAALLLRTLGYERVAQIVHEHVSVAEVDEARGLTEEELVNYADKRVQHTTVVTLDERYADLCLRYGKNAAAIEYINSVKARVRTIEQKIFSRLKLAADDLPKLLLTNASQRPQQ